LQFPHLRRGSLCRSGERGIFRELAAAREVAANSSKQSCINLSASTFGNVVEIAFSTSPLMHGFS